MKPYKNLKQALQEFVVADISYLKKYLDMSDEDKGDDLLRNFSYVIDDYLDELENLDDEELNELIDEAEWDYVAEYVQNNHPRMYSKITKDIVNKVDRFDLPDAEIPSWHYFDRPKILKNQWLIHFTEDADKIAKSGFNYLVDDITRLGLTTWMSKDYDRSTRGYGFAYTIPDYQKYGKAGRMGNDHKGWKYGSEVVLFRASGIRAWHVNDQEYQTIFKGDTVKEIIPITEGEEKDFAVYNKKTGNIIFEDDDLVRLVDWVLQNYRQYSKVI